jgi:UDP-N-acetylmuramate dehydrogenase
MSKNGMPFSPEYADRILQKIEGLTVLQNVAMSEVTRFRVGGLADVLVRPNNSESLTTLVQLARKENWPLTILGCCSNILVADAGIRGMTCVLSPGMTNIRRDGQMLTAFAGTRLDDLASYAAKCGLSGLEFACGIPGSVGGAVVMNAGAFGGSMEQVVFRTMYINSSGQTNVLEHEDHRFGYRQSFFSDDKDAVITEVSMKLKSHDRRVIYEQMAEHALSRYQKQPLTELSAGSAFRRPEGNYAGALISEVGMKGYKRGRAGVSDRHAGFIVNYGGASASEIVQVFLDVRNAVFQKTGVRLIPEVHFIGAWEDDDVRSLLDY